MAAVAHPREVLLGAQGGGVALPVCDHSCGVEARMRNSRALQAETLARTGVCGFDVTLDCEDGAPVGREAEHVELVLDMLALAAPQARVGVRVHPVDHPSFAHDVARLVGRAGPRLAYVMVPKIDTPADLARAAEAVTQAGAPQLPLHALIESPLAVHHAFDIAAQPRLQSLSFGVMDFVSSHGGAIPASAMSVQGQFTHPLVVRAKLAIASACHAHGKVPSHAVIPEFKDTQAFAHAAQQARESFGCTRMWSIHPDQIPLILQAFAPSVDEVQHAAEVMVAAAAADWAPVQVRGVLQDRASYRYFWQVLERAQQTGVALPSSVQHFF